MRNHNFEIRDPKIINSMLEKSTYGTLALVKENRPYSIPVNFVFSDNSLYFHGSQQGKKVEFLRSNSCISVSIVEEFSIIKSYFSSDEGLACPATQFFKSIVIDGNVREVVSLDKKREALALLMKKYQPEGHYKEFSSSDYNKMLKATSVFQIEIQDLECKFKFGQHLTKERFEKIVSYLEKSSKEIDKETLKIMFELRKLKTKL